MRNVYTVNMSRVIIEQIISADGFAVDTDGGMKFLNGVDPGNWDVRQLQLVERLDAIVFGRVTYGIFADYWLDADPEQQPVAKPINALPKHVVSNTLKRAPWGDGEISVESGDGVESVRRLRDQYSGDLMIWGSLTLADSLFSAGEVDVLRLRIVPTLIGSGRGVTPDDLPLTALELTSSHSSPGGQVTLEYAVR